MFNDLELTTQERIQIEKEALSKSSVDLIIPFLFIVFTTNLIFSAEASESLVTLFSDYQWYDISISIAKKIVVFGIPISFLSFMISIKFYYWGYRITSGLLITTYLLLGFGYFLKHIGLL